MRGFVQAGLAILSLGVIGVGAPASAQIVGERVAAVVNDAPISTFDVRQRMRLMVATQGVQIPTEALGEFEQQALRDLIDERLKLQEAARWELVIDDRQINDELARIAASGGGSVEALTMDLAAQGIDIGTLREKIRAEKAWENLVRGRYGSRINVTDAEIESQMAELREETQEEQFLVSEICLPVNGQADLDRMYDIGMQLIGQMREGVPFRALAQQFSVCPSAARGGDLGWLLEEEMNTDIAQLVTRLAPGNISRPVPVDGMMKLMALRQKREATEAGEPGYIVAYAGMPSSMGIERAEKMAEDLPLTNPCNGNALSADLGEGIGVSIMPMLPEREFVPAVQPVLAALAQGETSSVIEHDNAYHVFHLCEKDEGLGLPSRRALQSRMEAQELELLSRRYLRDVERDSAVEIRLVQEG